MISERRFVNQPIRGLQTMLRTIALFSDEYQRIIPDGIYGPETQKAVVTFQRNRGLPATGITNLQTWDEIVKLYDEALEVLSPPRTTEYEYQEEFPFTRGNQSPRLKIAQCMLAQIAERYCCICPPELSGSMDELMINSISEFQRMNALPVSGKLDKATWKNLILQFALSEIIANRHRK